MSSRTNTWLNYALPAEEVAAFLERIPVAGAAPTSATTRPRDPTAEQPGEFVSNFPALGLRLFNIGGRTRPAYVERVKTGSPAAQADLRANDLVLSVAGDQTATCDDFGRAVAKLTPGRKVTLIVKRGEEVKSLDLLVPETR